MTKRELPRLDLRRGQMHHGLSGFRNDHLGDQPPVAHGVVALEAQQAGRAFPNQLLGLRQFGLRTV